MTSSVAEHTDFTKDVLGRYVYNGLDEALASAAGVDGRPFDIIIVGGGAFGSTLAHRVLTRDRARRHRILVLDAGPHVVCEHVRSLPGLGLFPPPPSTCDPGVPRAEVWGLPWRSDVAGGFPGLAYCLGGRSIFWGGWAPPLLDAEMPSGTWPDRVVCELRDRSPIPGDRSYFAQAAAQTGVSQDNHLACSPLHRALRRQVFEGIAANAIADVVPLAEIPPHLDHPPSGRDPDMASLEAPLAVHGGRRRSGLDRIDMFSAMPLLMRAAREAQVESGGDDRRKRLMVVPNCHATTLETEVHEGVGRVVAVHVGGAPPIPVPERGVVVLAAGTIESTRLALVSFPETHGHDLIGTNLLSHVRSNHTFRIPRRALARLRADVAEWESSALLVRGRRVHEATDGTVSHFHLQVTASGCRGLGPHAEAELQREHALVDTIDTFAVIDAVDTFDVDDAASVDEEHIVVTLRGVGELQPHNPANRITLTDEVDEYGVRRAFVAMGNPLDPRQPGETVQTTNDRELWDAMDRTADELRAVIGGAPQAVVRARDGLGTTHHEAGTLWMGTNPASSVTNADGRFHHVLNTYALGPALLPSIGSPNPMLSGVALARRLGDHLVAEVPAPPLEDEFEWLFDGTASSFAGWVQAGPGRMVLDEDDGVLIAEPGPDIGLCYFGRRRFADFVLRLQFRIESRRDNSGVFVRFRDPCRPSGDVVDTRALANPAWIAVRTGFEVQIDDSAPGAAGHHRTGAIYDVPTADDDQVQVVSPGSPLQPGRWHDYEITVSGDSYQVRLDDHVTSRFANVDHGRGVSADRDAGSGFVGLQQHTGAVSFRAVRIREDGTFVTFPARPGVSRT